jgi:hypothetical protein
MSADGGEGGSLAEAVNDDSGKPRYDINKVQYGEKFGVNGSNTWVSGVVVTLLIIITAVCIILVVRRKVSI